LHIIQIQKSLLLPKSYVVPIPSISIPLGEVSGKTTAILYSDADYKQFPFPLALSSVQVRPDK